MEKNSMEDLFGPVIYSYSREQAIEDGVLVAFPEMQELAKEAGFTLPLALSAIVWNLVEPTGKAKEHGECWKGRLWDVFTMLRHAIQGSKKGESLIEFQVIFTNHAGAKETKTLWAQVGPGDNREPVLTIMLPEDY